MQTRLLLIVVIINGLIACNKNNGSAPTGGNPANPANPADSNVQLTVTIDSSIGAVIASHSPDTFLIRLKDPNSIKSVPVTYHVAFGAKTSSGVVAADGSVSDALDLSGNQVKSLVVTAKSGKTGQYVLAYEYLIENTGYPWVAWRFIIRGDSLFAATSAGLMLSVDDGKSFNPVAGAGNQQVLGLYVGGSAIYAGLPDRMTYSTDGGKTYSYRIFNGDPTFDAVPDIVVQNDTTYVATSKGVRISRDGWATYDSVISDFTYNGVTQVSCIAAAGGTVYAGTRSGFYISSDGGRTFTIDNKLTNPLGASTVQCNAVAIQNSVLFVGATVGIYRSADGGKSFSLGLFSNGLGAPVNRIFTTDSVVALASSYGLYLSWDGGVSYTVFRSQSGVGGGLLNNSVSVAVKGKTIYAGFFNNYLTILRPRS